MKIKNGVEMNNYDIMINNLNVELDIIKKLKKELADSLSNAPQGSLNIYEKGRKWPAYYLYQGGKKRETINDLEKVKMLAQKGYDRKALEILNDRETVIKQFIIDYMDTAVFGIYDSMSVTRKNLIKPIILPDDEYVKQWYDSHAGQQNDYPISTPYYSNRGEHMRSKSEKIIADMFYAKGIPYVYEPKIILPDGTIVCPDFIALNVRLRKTFIHEHFGMMSDGEYSDRTCVKLASYQRNGYMIGENLLFSMESKSEQLDTKIIERIMEHYLL